MTSLKRCDGDLTRGQDMADCNQATGSGKAISPFADRRGKDRQRPGD